MNVASQSRPQGRRASIGRSNTYTSTSHREYLASDRWKKLREYALEDQCYKCQRCKLPRWVAKIAFDQDLNVHHTSYDSLGEEDEFLDLEVLCRRCHELETYGRSDLAAPKSAICEICKGVHWNPWANTCDVCYRITGFLGGEGLQFYMDFPDFSLDPTILLRDTFLLFFISKYGVDFVIDGLENFEDMKKNNPNYGKRPSISDDDIPF